MLSPGGIGSPHQRWPVLQGAHASSGVNHSKLQNYCSEFLNGTQTLSNAKVGEGEMYMQFVPEPLPGGQVGAQLNLDFWSTSASGAARALAAAMGLRS